MKKIKNKLNQICLSFSIIPYAFADLSNTTVGGGTQSTVSGGGLPNPLGSSFMDILNSAISKLIIIAIPIATIMVIYGAFQMLTASGDPEKFKKGEKTLLYAAIGFGVLILAQGITDLIKTILGA